MNHIVAGGAWCRGWRTLAGGGGLADGEGGSVDPGRVEGSVSPIGVEVLETQRALYII